MGEIIHRFFIAAVHRFFQGKGWMWGTFFGIDFLN